MRETMPPAQEDNTKTDTWFPGAPEPQRPIDTSKVMKQNRYCPTFLKKENKWKTHSTLSRTVLQDVTGKFFRMEANSPEWKQQTGMSGGGVQAQSRTPLTLRWGYLQAVPINIPGGSHLCLVETDQLILKPMWKDARPRRAEAILKKNEVGRQTVQYKTSRLILKLGPLNLHSTNARTSGAEQRLSAHEWNQNAPRRKNRLALSKSINWQCSGPHLGLLYHPGNSLLGLHTKELGEYVPKKNTGAIILKAAFPSSPKGNVHKEDRLRWLLTHWQTPDRWNNYWTNTTWRNDPPATVLWKWSWLCENTNCHSLFI